jgi:superfamily II DNA or RNA helicase
LKKIVEKIRGRRVLITQIKKILMNSLKFVTDLVSSTRSFSSFDSKFSSLSKDFGPKEKGDAFEWFAKLYFLSYAKMYDVKRYFTRLDGQIPSRLGVSLRDVGTDSIIEHSSGEISLIQIKYRRPGYGLQRESVVNMAGESKLHPKAKVRSLILFSNVLNYPRLDEDERASIIFILKPELAEARWDLLQLYASSGISSKIPRNLTLDLPPLREWQKEALEWVLSQPRIGKSQLAIACGCGKSRLAREVITQGQYGQVLILVPNLQLLSQWFEMLSVSNPERDYLLIGSDLDVDKGDERIKPRYHLTTSVEEIAQFYVSSKNSIVISTYQSCNRIIESRIDFDLCVADEGHRCCSLDPNSNFSLPTRQDFPSSQMLFMTATPKTFKRSGEEDFRRGMDNEEIFGPRFTYSFKRAIEAGVISNYKIIVGYACIGEGEKFEKKEESDEELSTESSDKTENVTDDSRIEKFESRFLLKSVIKYELKNCLIFSNSHAKSKKLYDETVELAHQEGVEVECLLMRPNSRSSDKLEARQRIERGERLLIFNVRVFDVGSDLPKLESVMLSQGRKSITQTVQSVSRCLRKREGKVAKILVPCLVQDEEDLESDGGFRGLRSFLAALGSVDEAIVEEIPGKQGVKKRIFFDLVTNGRLERKGGAEEMKEIKEFEVAALERLGDSGLAGAMKKFEALKRFCIENDRLPKRTDIDVKVLVIFLEGLFSRNFEKYREKWLGELSTISSNMLAQIRPRLQKVQKYTLNPDEKFNALLRFVYENGSLPKRDDIYLNIKIGHFLSHLFDNERLKDKRFEMLDKLCEHSPNIKKQIELRLLNKEKWLHKLANIDDKVNILVEFVKSHNRLPKQKDMYQGFSVGTFFSNIIRGKSFIEKREEILCTLSDISESIRIQIYNRLTLVKPRSDTSPDEKFTAFLDYVEAHGKIPKSKETHQGVNIGSFWGNLLRGGYPENRVKWLQKLSEIGSIRNELEYKISTQKTRKSLSRNDRLNLLFEFVKTNNRLPRPNEVYKEVCVYNVYTHMTDKRNRKFTLTDPIKELIAVCPSIKDQIMFRLNDNNKKLHIKTLDRFNMLLEYVKRNGNLPTGKESLSVVLKDLLHGKKFLNQRKQWLVQLCSISSEISDQIHSRAKNYP